MRAYSNLNSIRLSSCRSLQQYLIRFNNAFEELTRTGATLPYGLILFWFIEFIDSDEYRFWKESFKTKIHELSDENLEEGNWIQQAQQELLDCNINPIGASPTSASEGKSSAKHLRDDSVADVNLTNKGTRNNLKWNKRTKSDTNGVSAKAEESAKSKPSTKKCNICEGPYATKDCYYTLKNPPS
jgi:hypothetical protein